MKSIAKKIYWILPPLFRRKCENIFKYSPRTNLTNKIIKYYSNSELIVTSEIMEILNFLSKNWVQPFPYKFKQEYTKLDINVFFDEVYKLPYVLHRNKRLFFRKSMNKKEVANNYKTLLAEQDSRSPHRYLTDDFFPMKEDIVVDVGAAEGIFSLNIIEEVKYIYMIECDKEWNEALLATFAPWRDKIEIIMKFASNTSNDNTMVLDELYERSQSINFIKVDVEGYEKKVLEGSQKILHAESNLKINLCTYHKQDDANYFSKLLTKMRFEVEFSKGYMLSIYPSESIEPYLRRGMIRAKK